MKLVRELNQEILDERHRFSEPDYLVGYLASARPQAAISAWPIPTDKRTSSWTVGGAVRDIGRISGALSGKSARQAHVAEKHQQ